MIMLKPLVRLLGILFLLSSFTISTYAFPGFPEAPGEDGNFPPLPPSLVLDATDNDGIYTITWFAPFSTTVTLYEKVGSGAFTSIYVGSAVSFNRTGQANGTYSYYVRSCNAYGCANSTVSAIVVSTGPVIPAAPNTPTSNSYANTGTYTISWNVPSGVTSYTLEERKNNTGSWTVFAGFTTNSKGFTCQSNGAYDYRVKACNSAGCSSFSAISTDVVVSNNSCRRIRFIHTDLLGSPVSETDEQGSVQ